MCLCVRKGGHNGKNKNPGRSGAARSPLLKPGWVGPGRSTARWRGCRNTGPVSQECFKRFSCHTWGGRSFIWNVLLRTANDQLKLDYFFLFVRQPAALAPARICADGKGIGQRKFAAHFSCLLSTLFLSEAIHLSVCQVSVCSCHISVLGVRPRFWGDEGLQRYLQRQFWGIYGGRGFLPGAVIWFGFDYINLCVICFRLVWNVTLRTLMHHRSVILHLNFQIHINIISRCIYTWIYLYLLLK